MTDKYLVLTTYPDHTGALESARGIVEHKLAACVNILPEVTSVYEWKGTARMGTEHLLIIKTTQSRYAALETFIRKHHPYELPEIIATPISHGLHGYLDWIEQQTQV